MYHLVDINVRNTNNWWQDFDIATQQPQHLWQKEHNGILHIPCNSTVTNVSIIAILKDIEYEKVQTPNMALKETMMHTELSLHCFMKQRSTNRLAQHRLPRTGKQKKWGGLTALLKNTNGGKGRPRQK